MDHLPYPEKSGLLPLRVPLIYNARGKYDYLGFANYPIRRGWAREDTLSEWLVAPSLAETTARAQEWLYLVLLKEFLGSGVFVSLSDYTNKADGTLLDSTVLPTQLQGGGNRSHYRTRQLNFRKRVEAFVVHLASQKQLLAEGEQQCNHFDQYLHQRGHGHSEADVRVALLISLSVRILIDTLRNDCSLVYDDLLQVIQEHAQWDNAYSVLQELCTPGTPHLLARPGPLYVGLLRDRLAKSNPCSAAVSQLLTKYSFSAAYYLGSLPRPASLHASLDHSRCHRRCVAQSGENFSAAHFLGCTDCTPLGPDMDEVLQIIERGGIPLVAISKDISGAIKLRVVEATFGVSYTAISHVWSGRLVSNPQTNTLPTCQLERLRNLYDQLAEARADLGYGRLSRCCKRTAVWFRTRGARTVLIWMDTLCVPTNDIDSDQGPQAERRRRLRAVAIDCMAQVYNNATDTVVLDNELHQLAYKSLSVEHRISQILLSPWMTRCWTFQEATMSRNCSVQFSDGLYSISRIVRDHDFSSFRGIINFPNGDIVTSSSSRDDLESELLGSLLDGTGWGLHNRNELHIFTKVWNNLCERYTSEPRDILGILAILLHIRPSDIMSLGLKMRLQAIFSALDRLPLALLYCDASNDGSKFSNWLPTAMEGQRLAHDTGHMYRSETDGKVLWFDSRSANEFHGEFEEARSQLRPTRRVQPCHYFVPAHGLSASQGPLFRLRQEAQAWIEFLLPSVSDLHADTFSQELCLLISDSKFSDTHSNTAYVSGVCLAINSREERPRPDGSKTRVETLQMTYICPLRLHASRPNAGDKLGKDAIEYPILESSKRQQLLPDVVYTIACDFRNPPQINNRRNVDAEYVTRMRYVLHVTSIWILVVYLFIAIIVDIFVVAIFKMGGGLVFLDILFMLLIVTLKAIRLQLYFRSVNTWVSSTNSIDIRNTRLAVSPALVPRLWLSLHYWPWLNTSIIIVGIILIGVRDQPVFRNNSMGRSLGNVFFIFIGEIMLLWCVEMLESTKRGRWLEQKIGFFGCMRYIKQMAEQNEDAAWLYNKWFEKSRMTKWAEIGLGFFLSRFRALFNLETSHHDNPNSEG